jgi:hypothetical protein
LIRPATINYDRRLPQIGTGYQKVHKIS